MWWGLGKAVSPNMLLLFLFPVFEAIKSRDHSEYSESRGGRLWNSRALLCARKDVLA